MVKNSIDLNLVKDEKKFKLVKDGCTLLLTKEHYEKFKLLDIDPEIKIDKVIELMIDGKTSYIKELFKICKERQDKKIEKEIPSDRQNNYE
jgi:hypothetical protein